MARTLSCALAHGLGDLELVVQPDHIHLFVCVWPIDSAAGVVKECEGLTAHHLHKQYAVLRRLPSLWTRSDFASTAGHVSQELLQRYSAAPERALGPTVDQCWRDLAIVTDPTQTGRQLRRMPIDTAPDRVEHLPGASLLHLRRAAAGTPVLLAPDALFLRVILRVDLAGCRKRDGPFPIRGQCPQCKMSAG
jgi:hypothetical protein